MLDECDNCKLADFGASRQIQVIADSPFPCMQETLTKLTWSTLDPFSICCLDADRSALVKLSYLVYLPKLPLLDKWRVKLMTGDLNLID